MQHELSVLQLVDGWCESKKLFMLYAPWQLLTLLKAIHSRPMCDDILDYV